MLANDPMGGQFDEGLGTRQQGATGSLCRQPFGTPLYGIACVADTARPYVKQPRPCSIDAELVGARHASVAPDSTGAAALLPRLLARDRRYNAFARSDDPVAFRSKAAELI